MRLPPALLAALAFLGACDPDAADPGAADAAPRPAGTTDARPVDPPYFVLGAQARSRDVRPTLSPADSAERARAQEAEMRARIDDVRRTVDRTRQLESAPDWRTADALVRDSVAAGTWDAHRLAVEMLDHHLLRGPLDDDKAEALGRYTDALLSASSEEGALILWALMRLEGRWDERRRQGAAAGAANNLGAAFVRIAGCIDCTVDEALAGMWPQRRRASEDRLHDMAEVHRRLREIARGDTPMPGP